MFIAQITTVRAFVHIYRTIRECLTVYSIKNTVYVVKYYDSRKFKN